MVNESICSVIFTGCSLLVKFVYFKLSYISIDLYIVQGDYDQHFQVWKSNKYVLATAFPPMTLYTNIEESLYNAEIEHRSVLRLQEVFETPKKPEKRSKPSVIPKSSKSLSKKPSVQKISHGSSVSSASQQESSSDSDCVPDENEFKISMDPDILNIIGSIQNQLSFCIESEDDSTSSMESGSDSSPVVSNQSRSNSNSYRQPSVPKSTSITDALTAEDSVEEICSDDSGEYPITPIHSNKGKPKPIGFFDAKKISISIDQSDSNEEEISYEGEAGNERESEAEGGVDIIESEEESEEDSVSKDSFVVDDDDEVLQSSSDSDSAPKTKSTKKKPSMFEESIEIESSTSSASLEEDYISLDSPSPPKKVGKKSTVTKKRKSTIIYKDDSVEIQVFDDSPMIKKNKSTANDSSSEEEEEHSADSEDDESPKRPIVVEPITNATPLKRVSIFKMATPRRSVVRPNNVEIIDLDDSPPKKKQSKQSTSAESDYSDRTSVSQEYDSESVETSESPKFSLYSPVKESYIPTPPKAASKKQFKPKIPAKQFERNHVIALDDDESVQLVDSEPVNPRGKVANNSIKEKEKEKENDTPMTLNNQLATKKPFGMDHNLDHFKESVCGADGVIRNLNVPLLKHQIMGVNWMIQREKSVFDRASVARCAGGILADDMGLGKTIQTIATVLKNPSPHKWKSTLIVCTLSTVSQWEKEILTKTYPDNYLKVSLYYGNKRESDPTVLAASDIVLTTYGVLQSEFSKGKPEHMTLIDPDMININDLPKPKGRSGKAKVKSTAALFQVKWWRVVLDEGHVIKNRQTGKHKAAVRLEAYNRWCLTGTPIQNELKDIWSLLHFIRAPDCENLRVFNSYVADIKNMNSESALKKLQQLIEPLLLRREKSILKEDKESSFSDLPPCKIEFVYLDFTEDENIFYQKLWDAATQDFEQLRAKGLVIKNYMHIFEQILRLRQACNHIYLLMKDSSLLCDINGRDNSAATLCRINIQANLAMKELRKAIKDKPAAPVPSGDFRLTPFSNLRAIEMDNVDTCTICVSEADNPVITPCHHIFCLDCITDWFNESSKDTLYFECPNCRNRVASHLLKSVVIKKKKKRRSTWADTRIQKSLTSACPPASSSSKYNLQGLPDDILVKIFSYCQQDIKTIFALNLVCSKFYAITTTLFRFVFFPLNFFVLLKTNSFQK